ECRRFAGEGLLDVSGEVARIEPTHAIDVLGGPHAETPVSVVRPVDLVVPALAARLREVRKLVVDEPRRFESVHCPLIELEFPFLADRLDLPVAALFPEPRPLLVREPIRRDAVWLQCENL